MTIKTPQQLAAEYTRTMPQPDSVRARDWIAERIILAVQEDRRQLDILTEHGKRVLEAWEQDYHDESVDSADNIATALAAILGALDARAGRD